MLIYLLISACMAGNLFFVISWITGISPSEKRVRFVMRLTQFFILIIHSLLLAHFLLLGPLDENFQEVVRILDYTLDFHFRVDATGLIFGFLTSILVSVVTHYSFEYLSRETGFLRFFSLVSGLQSALLLISYSANYDGIAIGWELAGICSILLIGFFHHHERGARSSLYALINYKFGDAALLTAIGLMHHHAHSTNFDPVHRVENASLLLPAFLIFSTLPKSAQFPFSAWIKRAIEGPSASTAIFYGALSIHLGPFLLIRSAPIWENHFILRVFIFFSGLLTTLIATSQARTRSDAKSVLVAASQAQVGLIFIELAFGLKTLALLHLIGHAGLRTWQLLRASTILQDFQDNPAVFSTLLNRKPSQISPRLYHWLNQGFYVEHALELLLLWPFKKISTLSDSKTRTLLVAIGNGIFAFLISKFLPGWLWISLLPIVWQSLRSLGTASIFHSFFLVALSQLAQIWVGVVCTQSPWSLIGFTLFCEIPLIFFTGYGLKRIDRQISLQRKEFFFGLHSINPELFPIFLFLILLMTGVPFGVTFFSDDLIFHVLLNQSIAATFLMIASLGLNSAALLKIVYRLFWGHSRDGELSTSLSVLEKWGIRTLVVLYAVGGLFVGQIFGIFARWTS